MTAASPAGSAGRAPVADRLSLAREVLDRAHGSGLGGRRARPDVRVAGPAGVMALTEVIAGLFPGGGLPRGSTIGLTAPGAGAAGGVGLVFALAAAASAAGAWCAMVGMPDAGMVAAAEAGMAVERVALVPRPGERLAAVTAALLDGLDLVAIAGWAGVPAGTRARLMAQARARGSVLLAVDDRAGWPGADLRVGYTPDTSVGPGGWVGLHGGRHGRLRQRLVRIQVRGAGLPHVGRSASVWWPGPHGQLAARSDTSAAMVPSGLAGTGEVGEAVRSARARIA